MAILGEIRKRIWILFIFVGIALFAFLFNPDQWSTYFKSNPNILGKVDGENISREDFDVLNRYLQNRSNGQASQEDVWKMSIQNKIISDLFDKSGMKLTEDNFWTFAQYSSMFSQDRALYDEKGNFNPKTLKDQVIQIEEKAKTDEQAAKAYENWLKQKKIAEAEIKGRLYFNALTKGLLVNKKEINSIKSQLNENAVIDFIKIDYETYNQKNKIKVTKEDLEEYIKARPNRFKREASVGLKYVVFRNQFTPQDDSIALKNINAVAKGGVIKDEKGKIVDSIKSFNSIDVNNAEFYADDHSDIKIPIRYVAANQQPQPIQSWVTSAEIGSTFGPYVQENYYVVSKLLDKKASDSILSKHILISFKGAGDQKQVKRTKEQAKKLADSILNQVSKNPIKFDELAKLSDDTGSANQGGSLGWTTPETSGFVPQFQQFLNSNPKGKTGIAETQFGYHIINIQDKRSGNFTYSVLNILKERKPSQKTTDENYKKANTFIQSVQGKEEKEFSTLAKKYNYEVIEQKSVSRFINQLQGIDNQTGKLEDILKWSFNNDRNIGDSDIFTSPTNDHVVVLLTAKNSKGLADAESVRPEIETIVRNKKIAKLLIEKINNSKKSLDVLAKEYTSPKMTNSVNFQNPIVGNANEPKVAGVAFGMKLNTISKAIEGNTGVFVISTKKIDKLNVPSDVKQLKDRLKGQNAQLAPYSILTSLEKNADIKDLRIEANQQ